MPLTGFFDPPLQPLLQPIQFLRPLIEQLLPSPEQRPHFRTGFFLRGGHREVKDLAIVREDLRIQRIGLGPLAHGARKRAHFCGMRHRDRQGRAPPLLDEQAFIPARGFTH